MLQHEQELGERCAGRVQMVKRRNEQKRIRTAFVSACRTDIASMGSSCSGGYKVCMQARRSQLSSTCRTALEERERSDAEAARSNMNVLDTCKAEATSYCKEQKA